MNMDAPDTRRTASNLLGKFLDCVKVLDNESWPDNFPEMLYDVVEATKSFAEKLQPIEPKPIINSGLRSRTRKPEKRRCGINKAKGVALQSPKHRIPRVIIKRLDVEIQSVLCTAKVGGVHLDKLRKHQTKPKSSSSNKENLQSSTNDSNVLKSDDGRKNSQLRSTNDCIILSSDEGSKDSQPQSNNGITLKSEKRKCRRANHEYEGKASGCLGDGCTIN